MPFDSITQNQILDLLNCPKQAVAPLGKEKEIEGRRQVNYSVVATDGTGQRFDVFLRQNIRAGMEKDFSCGISWVTPSGETLVLRRYNGGSHPHRNSIEKTELPVSEHIHHATEEYIRKGKRPEGFAEVTDRFHSLAGALHCLVQDCKISGLEAPSELPPQGELFIS